MSIYLVDEHHTTHTCPADPEPHSIAVTRTVVHVTAGGPCRTPVAIRCGTRTVEIPCGRHEPAHRQCGACRTIVMVGTITAEHLGHHDGGQDQRVSAEAVDAYADLRCDVCDAPLDPILAKTGRHLLCHPTSRTNRAAA